MANINVTANSSDLFSIALDMWEWTGLTVNGSTVAPINTGGVQFQYNQLVPGSIHFVATANQNIVLVNPGTTLFMKSPDGTKTYMLIISYSEVDSVITLNGHLNTLPFPFSEAGPSPLTFSQGRMTGCFQISS